ncbi:uncharacterized protein LOC126829390 [Patella vulgata]|uniref:uncharacterized protein LOC126829390 n=1 Tax=Patella vulgata TaxID=6465 RepID=UPI0024A9FCD0|nr:uncharacterized protein LOC126829390 [Patella vulgata]
MMSQFYVYYVVALLCFKTGTVAGGDDLTRKDNQKGVDVVEAVVDLIRSNCIFPSDHEFLRRLALVQSDYGEDQKAYSNPKYHGGIWQIDQDKYNIIRSCPGKMSAICDQINSNLSIDWRHTDWEDLRKPLYSGLAAALYTMYGYQSDVIPSNIYTQASIWQVLFAPGQNTSVFTSIKPFVYNCDSMKLDLAFIIDDSGSIGFQNFIKVLNFMTNVTEDFPIGADNTRVGVVVFTGLPDLAFDFKTYFTKAEIQSAIMNIAYIGGGTGTADGLDLARTRLFNESAGSRMDATKVALLITDGYSNSHTNTKMAAGKLRDLGVTIFAIGVGDSFIEELNDVATPPVCTHVYSINNFDDFHTILNAIQKDACTAPLIVKQIEQVVNGTNSSIPVEVKTKVDIPKNNTNTGPVMAYPKTCNQTTIITETLCGMVELFASFETSHPGKAFYEYSGVAIDGLPSIMKITGDSQCRPLYVSYQATSLLIEKCQNLTGHFTTTSVSGEHPGSEIVCRRNGKERNCTIADFQLSNYKESLCPDPWGNIPNPCTPKSASQTSAKLFHPHPVDVTKFIKCDDLGEMYVTQCPPGKEYDDEVAECGKEDVIKVDGKDKQNLPDSLNHLCIDELRPGTHFYAHPTNKHQYLECDLSGHAWVFDCPANHIWQQDGLSCIVDPLYTTNPCTSLAHTLGQNYFPLPDPKKYISCDIHNNMSINECPSNTNFSDVLHKCVEDAGIIG